MSLKQRYRHHGRSIVMRVINVGKIIVIYIIVPHIINFTDYEHKAFKPKQFSSEKIIAYTRLITHIWWKKHSKITNRIQCDEIQRKTNTFKWFLINFFKKWFLAVARNYKDCLNWIDGGETEYLFKKINTIYKCILSNIL